jgi:hypothetical protein
MARIAAAFKPTGHPDVRSAKRTREAVQAGAYNSSSCLLEMRSFYVETVHPFTLTAEFYATFGIGGSGPAAVLNGSAFPVPPSAGTSSGGSAVVVSAEDWEDYFAHVSAGCGDDDIFFEQVRR